MTSALEAIASAGRAYARAVGRIEPALIRDPIVRLQNLGRESANSLYEPPPASARTCTLEYLFGVPRLVLPGNARRDLLDLQESRCFYSDEKLRPSDAHVDHFIPWSRHALSTIENLVLCHRRENSAKSNHLAAPRFLQSWAARLRDRGDALREIAFRYRLEFAPKRTVAVAATLYRHIARDAPLWSGADRFELARPDEIRLTLQTALGGR